MEGICIECVKWHRKPKPPTEETVVYLKREGEGEGGGVGGGGNISNGDGERETAVEGRVDLGKDQRHLPTPLRLSPKQPPLSHRAEGLTVRMQLPRQPLWLPWRSLCVKDQSVGRRLKGLRPNPTVPSHDLCDR